MMLSIAIAVFLCGNFAQGAESEEDDAMLQSVKFRGAKLVDTEIARHDVQDDVTFNDTQFLCLMMERVRNGHRYFTSSGMNFTCVQYLSIVVAEPLEDLGEVTGNADSLIAQINGYMEHACSESHEPSLLDNIDCDPFTTESEDYVDEISENFVSNEPSVSESLIEQASLRSSRRRRMLSFRRRRRVRDLTDAEKTGADEAAVAAVMKGYAQALGTYYCSRETWARGMANRVCKSGWKLEGGHCYPASCGEIRRRGARRRGGPNSATYRSTDWCYESCPRDWNSVVTTCAKEEGFVFGIPTIFHNYDQLRWHVGQCRLNENRCSECPSGTHLEGEGCYHDEPTGYTCHSAGTLTCYRDCTEPLAVGCTLNGCAATTGECAGNILNKIVGVGEVAFTAAMAVGTGGLSLAATASWNAGKAAVKAAARNGAAKVRQQIADQGFRAVVQGAVRQALTKVRNDVTTAMPQQVLAKYVEYRNTQADALEARLAAKLEANGGDAAATAVEEFDPTGLADAIDSVTGDDTDGEAQIAAKWVNFVGTFDPSGVLAAAALFIGERTCEQVDQEMSETFDSTPGVGSGRAGGGKSR